MGEGELGKLREFLPRWDGSLLLVMNMQLGLPIDARHIEFVKREIEKARLRNSIIVFMENTAIGLPTLSEVLKEASSDASYPGVVRLKHWGASGFPSLNYFFSHHQIKAPQKISICGFSYGRSIQETLSDMKLFRFTDSSHPKIRPTHVYTENINEAYRTYALIPTVELLLHQEEQ